MFVIFIVTEEKQSFLFHGDEELGKGLLLEILKQIELSKEEYDKLRRKV